MQELGKNRKPYTGKTRCGILSYSLFVSFLAMPSNIFEQLKRKKSVIPRQKAAVDAVFFQLQFDQAGAYLSVVNEKLEPVDVRYEYYSGHTRDLLRSLEYIHERNSFRIDWERPADHVYLAENEYLLWQLQHCDNFLDAKGQPIRFAEDDGRIVVELADADDRLKATVALRHQGNTLKRLRFVAEDHVFANGQIYRTQPLGEHFQDLRHFETTLLPAMLEKYLSLLYSFFEAIAVKYDGYRPTDGPPKHTQPTLVFEKVDADNSLYLRVSSSLPGFDADFFDNYDIAKVAALNDMEKTIVVSDVLHEEIYACFSDIEKMLRKYKRGLKERGGYVVEDNLFIIEENLAKAFIHNELTHLIMRFTIFGAEKLKSYKVQAVTPKLNLSLSHGIDFLEGDAQLEIEGQLISLFDALNQYKKQSYIQLTDGTHAIVNKQYMQKLQRLFKKKKQKVRVSFFDLPLVEELMDENMAQKTFKRSRDIFLGFNELQHQHVTYPELQTELRDYQKQGFKWIAYLHRHALGGCLADDMGLGKTLQAIAILATVYPGEEKSSLIIMPRSLLFNWANEIQKFRPDLTFYTYHGPNRDLEQAKQHHLILTTYATARNDIEQFKDEEFYYIILDESQNIKNLASQTSKAAMLLKSKHRLALSGTPVENNLGELYSLFRFLNPAMFGSVEDFNAHYATPIQRENDKDALHELQKKIYPFILRRLKQDVLQDLPDKIEQTLFVDMTPDQQVFYEQRRLFYYQTVREQIAEHGIRQSQFVILQALTELRQIASTPEAKSDNAVISPKREVLVENVLDVLANGHKVLVFANFLNALDTVGQDLDAHGIDYLLMTGATRERERLVQQFQNDETYKVFLMTLKTGGIGLNLTAADYIFIYDPWWNKAAENQAIDRTHRIGQDKTVFSYKLITRGTIEEKMLKLQELKSDLFDSLIASDSASIKSLDEQDVEFVLGG
jgi:SNF2 family DNA or RNA helicase